MFCSVTVPSAKIIFWKMYRKHGKPGMQTVEVFRFGVLDEFILN